jgi:hypothetical protein
MLIDGQPASTATAVVPLLRAQLALAGHDPEAARIG